MKLNNNPLSRHPQALQNYSCGRLLFNKQNRTKASMLSWIQGVKKEYFTVKFSRFFTPLYPAKLKRNPRSSCKRYLRVVKSSSIGTCLEFESDFLTTAEYIDFVGGAAVLATATGDASLDFCDCDVTISWISLALRCDVNWLLAWNVGQIHSGKEPNLLASAYNIPSV